jgi:hypothetical protein
MSATNKVREQVGSDATSIYGAKAKKGTDNKVIPAGMRKNYYGALVPAAAPAAPAPVHQKYYDRNRKGLGKVQSREDGGTVTGAQPSTLYPQVESPSFASNSDYASSDDQPQGLLGRIGSAAKSYGKNSKGVGDDYNPQPAMIPGEPARDQDIPDLIASAPSAPSRFGTIARNMAPMAKGGSVKGLGSVRGLTPRDAGGTVDSGPDYSVGENGVEGLHMDPGSSGTVIPNDQLIADNQQPQTAMVQPKAYAGPAPSVDPERATEQTLVDQKAKDSLASNDIVGLGSAMLGHRALDKMYSGLGTVQAESTPAMASSGVMPAPKTAMAPTGMPTIPTYGGPGKAVAPGDLIPAKQLPQDELQYKRAQLKQQMLSPDLTVAGNAERQLAEIDKQSPWGSAMNHPGWAGRLGHIAATVGNVAGDIAAPGTMANLPGTAMNRERTAEGALGKIKLGSDVSLQSAQTQNQLEDIKTKQEALKDPNRALTNTLIEKGYTLGKDPATGQPVLTEIPGFKDVPKTMQDLLATSVAAAQKAGGDPMKDPHVQGVLAAIQAAQKPEKDSSTAEDERYEKINTDQSLGNPVSKPDAAWARAYEKRKLLGPSATSAAADTRQATTEDFSQKEAGRQHLTKEADGPYSDTVEKADTLRNAIVAAQHGNMEAASLAPLLAVLGVTTMEGIKRINAIELQTVAGAGSLWDQIQGKIGKAKAGQPMDPSLQKNLSDLADMLEKGAYKKYRDKFDTITKRYKLTGDETPKDGPIKTVNGVPYMYDGKKWVKQEGK